MLERRIKDPRLGFVTITDVRVTGDTQQATIFYTVLGEDDRPRRHGGGARVGQGPDPLRGRQAARHAARAVADVRPRRAARDGPPPRRGAGQGQGARTRRSRRPARARRTPASADPYKKPREVDDDDDADDDDEPSDRVRAGRRRQAGRDDLPRRRRPGPPAGRHPQGRPRRHPRPDGDRRAGARRRPGHPAARPPDADREGVRRHGPARRRHHDRRRRGRGDGDRSRPPASTRRRCARRPPRSSARSSRCPSAVSAIKVDGKRAYQRVRAGEEVELAPGSVTVHELVVHDVRLGDDVVDVDLSRALLQRHLRPRHRPRPRRGRSGSAAT